MYTTHSAGARIARLFQTANVSNRASLAITKEEKEE